jgi:uncharacterized protein YjbI with pentapeptide repeats
MVITSVSELLHHIEQTDAAKLKNTKIFHFDEVGINKKAFKGYTFAKLHDRRIELKNCRFTDCIFEDVKGFFLIFNNCKFLNCQFSNSVFSHLQPYWEKLEFDKCVFRNVQWDEGALFNVWFDECHFYTFSMIGMVPISYIVFNKCIIEHGQFQSIVYYESSSQIDAEVEDLVFQECVIDSSYFNTIDLRNSFFINTPLYKSAFIDCEFNSDTIVLDEKSKKFSYASIDFQSIIKSQDLGSVVLKDVFNIHSPKIKDLAMQVTTKLEFKTVFISYSFKDKALASLLNSRLGSKGVKTFLWENDAPVGNSLEDIMANNVKKHDRVLFIASIHSLTSKACQYELSEGRKKQEQTWQTVFLPIHIDSFLFSVKKNQIRPVAKAEEYWENIEELRRINSIDLSSLDMNNIDSEKINSAIEKIITELETS